MTWPLRARNSDGVPVEAVRICGITRVEQTIESLKATHLISVLAQENYFERPRAILEDCHLRVTCLDSDSRGNIHAPKKYQIEYINEWVECLPEGSRLLVHCLSGVSRSPAVALGILAKKMGPVDAVDHLFDLCPFAMPNLLIVRHWDKQLRYRGRLLDALVAHRNGPNTHEVQA